MKLFMFFLIGNHARRMPRNKNLLWTQVSENIMYCLSLSHMCIKNLLRKIDPENKDRHT